MTEPIPYAINKHQVIPFPQIVEILTNPAAELVNNTLNPPVRPDGGTIYVYALNNRPPVQASSKSLIKNEKHL